MTVEVKRATCLDNINNINNILSAFKSMAVAQLQKLQDLNVSKLKDVRCEINKPLMKRKREYVEGKINYLHQKGTMRIVRICIEKTINCRRVTNPNKHGKIREG